MNSESPVTSMIAVRREGFAPSEPETKTVSPFFRSAIVIAASSRASLEASAPHAAVRVHHSGPALRSAFTLPAPVCPACPRSAPPAPSPPRRAPPGLAACLLQRRPLPESLCGAMSGAYVTVKFFPEHSLALAL